jgi:hypothetical protein
MIDNIFNLVFRCGHRRLTRPVTPVNAAGKSAGSPYVVCLDCGNHFSYDLTRMKMGKVIRNPKASGTPAPPAPRSKLKRVVWISVPIGILLGAVLKRKGKKR